MTWTYSGDPSKTDLDKYRFLIGDNEVDEPVLQDEEITFVLNTYATSSQDVILYNLYSACVQYYARRVSRKLGPQTETTTDRLKFFNAKCEYYRKRVQQAWISLPTFNSDPSSNPSSDSTTGGTFRRGMMDNMDGIGSDNSC